MTTETLRMACGLIKQFVRQIREHNNAWTVSCSGFLNEANDPKNDIFHFIDEFFQQTVLINSRPAA